MRTHHSTRLGAAALCLLVAGSVLASGMSAAATPAEGKPAAMPQGKGNSSGVLMRQVVPEKIALGESVVLKLTFSGVTAADGAGVEVTDLATRTTLLSVRLAQGEQKTIELPYTGRTDGLQFIVVTTTQAGRSSVQSVPLRVGSGEARLKAEGQRRATPSGEAVISLPAASPPAASK
jgi:hypothetical protein